MAKKRTFSIRVDFFNLSFYFEGIKADTIREAKRKAVERFMKRYFKGKYCKADVVYVEHNF